jgi:hypothetical protein
MDLRLLPEVTQICNTLPAVIWHVLFKAISGEMCHLDDKVVAVDIRS